MDGNRFGDEGVKIICSALTYSKIVELDFSNNGLGEQSLTFIKDLVEKNNHIKKIIF